MGALGFGVFWVGLRHSLLMATDTGTPLLRGSALVVHRWRPGEIFGLRGSGRILGLLWGFVRV